MSHCLPRILAYCPGYHQNLRLIAARLTKETHRVVALDIGANIGDTALILRRGGCGPILCIEADPFFFELLVQNTRSLDEVSYLNSFISASTESLAGELRASDGTARIIEKANGRTLGVTMTEAIRTWPYCEQINLVKIDTDGHDLEVIRGGLSFFKRVQPVIYFEYDPSLLPDQKKESSPTIFEELRDIGYQTALIFDNIGLFMRSIHVGDCKQIEELHHYLRIKQPGRFYADICVFHNSHSELAECVRQDALGVSYQEARR